MPAGVASTSALSAAGDAREAPLDGRAQPALAASTPAISSAHDVAPLQALAEPRRRVDRHDLAAVDDEDAVGDLAHLGQDVRREDDGVLAPEFGDQLADLEALLRVEAGRRLVQNEHGRLVDDGLRQADALPEPLG